MATAIPASVKYYKSQDTEHSKHSLTSLQQFVIIPFSNTCTQKKAATKQVKTFFLCLD